MLCLGQRSTPHGERRASTMRHDAAAAVARCRRAITRSHANSFFEQAGTRERALGYLSGEGAVAESRDERSDAVRVLADASTTPFFANSIFGLSAIAVSLLFKHASPPYLFPDILRARDAAGRTVTQDSPASGIYVSAVTWRMRRRVGGAPTAPTTRSNANLFSKFRESVYVREDNGGIAAQRCAVVRGKGA